MTLQERVGAVTHFYNHIGVAVIRLETPLALGDLIYFLGTHTDFGQEVESMQIEHQPVRSAAPGCEVAVKVHHRVRAGDAIYHVSELDAVDEGYEDLELPV